MVKRNLPILGGKENRKEVREGEPGAKRRFLKTGHETGLTGIENGIKTGLKRDLLELEMVKRFFQKDVQNNRR